MFSTYTFVKPYHFKVSCRGLKNCDIKYWMFAPKTMCLGLKCQNVLNFFLSIFYWLTLSCLCLWCSASCNDFFSSWLCCSKSWMLSVAWNINNDNSLLILKAVFHTHLLFTFGLHEKCDVACGKFEYNPRAQWKSLRGCGIHCKCWIIITIHFYIALFPQYGSKCLTITITDAYRMFSCHNMPTWRYRTIFQTAPHLHLGRESEVITVKLGTFI